MGCPLEEAVSSEFDPQEDGVLQEGSKAEVRVSQEEHLRKPRGTQELGGVKGQVSGEQDAVKIGVL